MLQRKIGFFLLFLGCWVGCNYGGVEVVRSTIAVHIFPDKKTHIHQKNENDSRFRRRRKIHNIVSPLKKKKN